MWSLSESMTTLDNSSIPLFSRSCSLSSDWLYCLLFSLSSSSLVFTLPYTSKYIQRVMSWKLIPSQSTPLVRLSRHLWKCGRGVSSVGFFSSHTLRHIHCVSNTLVKRVKAFFFRGIGIKCRGERWVKQSSPLAYFFLLCGSVVLLFLRVYPNATTTTNVSSGNQLLLTQHTHTHTFTRTQTLGWEGSRILFFYKIFFSVELQVPCASTSLRLS